MCRSATCEGRRQDASASPLIEPAEQATQSLLRRPIPRAIPVSLQGSDALGFERIEMRGESEEDLSRGQRVAVGVV